MKLRYEESYVKLRVKQHVIFTVYDYILHLTLLLTPVKYDKMYDYKMNLSRKIKVAICLRMRRPICD